MDANSLPKIVTRQRRGCDLNPGPSAPESSTLTTRLPSHPYTYVRMEIKEHFDCFISTNSDQNGFMRVNDTASYVTVDAYSL